MASRFLTFPDVAEDLNTSQYLRALVELAFWAHMRLGELVALQHGDLDLDVGTVRIERQVVETDAGPTVGDPKVGSRRTVHLPRQAVEALSRHLEKMPPSLPETRVFVRPDGSELRAHHVHAAWKTARVKAEVPEAHLHDLRHAGLTLAAQSGATLAEVMRRAGHVPSKAAMIYQHAAESRDAEVADRLSELSPRTSGSAVSGAAHAVRRGGARHNSAT